MSTFATLRRALGFTILAVTILATTIAATTVMFTLVRAVLLRDMPFNNPDELVWMYNKRTERDRAPLSYPDLQDYRQAASTLKALALFTNWTTNLTGAGTPERLDGLRVSGNFFEVLGTQAALGRVLEPPDEANGDHVAVITHGLWQRRFGADVAVIGKSITLNGGAYTVVGVLPRRFLFPFRDAELAVPVTLASDPRRADRGANFLRVVARLAPGVTVSQANADLDAIAAHLQLEYPAENARKTGISLYPLEYEIVRDYGAILWTLFASVGVLLIVGCVNLANLLLVRGAGRRTEFAVRQSLGASRARLVCQLLAEAALLVAIGTGVGLVLAQFGLTAWRAWGPSDFPQMADAGIDGPVLAFAIGLSALTAVGCGIVPAWVMSRSDNAPLAGTSRTIAGNNTQRKMQHAFVAAQIAASTVLLVGMMLMTRGLGRLEHVSAGFTPSQSLSLQLSLPPSIYGNRAALVSFYDVLYERLKATPGIESAGTISLLPLSGLLSTADVSFPDRPAPPPSEVPQAHLRVTSPEYFAAAGVSIVDGRSFNGHDREDGQPVAIVSHTFATRHWPDERAIGKSVQIVQAGASPQLEIVGVVQDVKQFGLDGPTTADLYLPLPQMPAFQAPLMASRMYWVVKSHDGVVATTDTVRAAVTAVDPTVATSSARTLEALWASSLGSRRANVLLLQAFGCVALVLCAVGVYGVTAYAARARRRDLAVRAALGATRRQLIVSMVRTEAPALLLGLGAGLVAALALAPLLFSSAFETSPRDLVTYVTVAAMLTFVAGFAIYFPLRRAGSANAAEVLQP